MGAFVCILPDDNDGAILLDGKDNDATPSTASTLASAEQIWEGSSASAFGTLWTSREPEGPVVGWGDNWPHDTNGNRWVPSRASQSSRPRQNGATLTVPVHGQYCQCAAAGRDTEREGAKTELSNLAMGLAPKGHPRPSPWQGIPIAFVHEVPDAAYVPKIVVAEGEWEVHIARKIERKAPKPQPVPVGSRNSSNIGRITNLMQRPGGIMPGRTIRPQKPASAEDDEDSCDRSDCGSDDFTIDNKSGKAYADETADVGKININIFHDTVLSSSGLPPRSGQPPKAPQGYSLNEPSLESTSSTTPLPDAPRFSGAKLDSAIEVLLAGAKAGKGRPSEVSGFGQSQPPMPNAMRGSKIKMPDDKNDLSKRLLQAYVGLRDEESDGKPGNWLTDRSRHVVPVARGNGPPRLQMSRLRCPLGEFSDDDVASDGLDNVSADDERSLGLRPKEWPRSAVGAVSASRRRHAQP